MILVTPLHHRNKMDQMDQRKTEFAVIFFDGLNQGSRLRRILSAKLEMLYTNGNANVYIRILGPLRRIGVADF